MADEKVLKDEEIKEVAGGAVAMRPDEEPLKRHYERPDLAPALAIDELKKVIGGAKDVPDGFPEDAPGRYPNPGLNLDLEKLLESLTEEQLEAIKASETGEAVDMTWLEKYLKNNLQ